MLLAILCPYWLCAHTITGIVLEENSKGEFTPLHGAVVFWLGSNEAQLCDSAGVFHIPEHDQSKRLVISYLGYMPDTITVNDHSNIRIILANKASKNLHEIEVSSRNYSTFQNVLSPLNTKIVLEKELFKAACCNLSESFETNPSIDVSYTDALTGAKQINMLGLSGSYTQMLNENLPATRGLATNHGLAYTPGTWIESMQVTKGVGSVANGYESVVGQINVELKKPEKKEKFLLNAYANHMMRYEINANVAGKISNNWHSGTLIHANTMNGNIDHNHDGFLDLPKGVQFNIYHRHSYADNQGRMFQIGIRPMIDERIGGHIGVSDLNNDRNIAYGIGNFTKRIELTGKAGYVFPQKKFKSIGLQTYGLLHHQNAFFGLRNYTGHQNSLYVNLIYQSIIGNTSHKFRTGISFLFDAYHETYIERMTYDFMRGEYVPGVFVEHTSTINDKTTAILGLRLDYNSIYGPVFTPRLHAKYQISDNDVLSIGLGTGARTANIFAENTAVLVSSRSLVLNAINNGFAYGLSQERALNAGLSYTKTFYISDREGEFSTDYYHTNFENVVVVDMENAREIQFYNIKGLGNAFSHAIQAEFMYELFQDFEIRCAYRWQNVQNMYNSGVFMQKPFVAPHRAFVNLAYKTGKKWNFDATISWFSSKRIPTTAINPIEYQFENFSPSYALINVQLSKTWLKTMDVYIGGENIGDFVQERLILSHQNPYGNYFDASLVWGPVIGRMFYAGIRYRVIR